MLAALAPSGAPKAKRPAANPPSCSGKLRLTIRNVRLLWLKGGAFYSDRNARSRNHSASGGSSPIVCCWAFMPPTDVNVSAPGQLAGGCIRGISTRAAPVPVRTMIVFADYENGGIERAMVNLANGLAENGVAVEFAVNCTQGPFLDLLSPTVEVRKLVGATQAEQRRWLQQHVRLHRPDVLLPVKEKAELLAAAIDRRGTSTRLYMCMHSMPASVIRQGSLNPVRRWQKRLKLRRLYRRADRTMAVSSAAADELATITGLPRTSIAIVHNGVVTPELAQEAQSPAPHPWLEQANVPVILGVGRFSRVKDFVTLIRAFHCLRGQRPCRLIIIGEGRQRKRLMKLIETLRLEDDVDLPGFTANPYPYLAHADVFVLPSRQEAFGMVLVEAMALGTAVVATDCPGAPREILEGGRLAPLVPVGDPAAMAAAIASILDHPPAAAALMEAASRYSVAASARAYLDVFSSESSFASERLSMATDQHAR
jgi:glycosyltransferase involved in cell wall biosynthesis